MPDEEGTVVNNEADVSTAPTDTTTEENTDSQAESTEQDVDSQDQDTEESDDSTDESDKAEDDAEKPKSGADARKEQLNGQIDDANREIRELNERKNNIFQERAAIRQEVERINSQVYKPASVDQLIEQQNPETGEYFTRLEAQFESMRQEREVEKYNNQVADAQMGLQYEASKAIQDFPMFDQNSPEYDADLAREVDQILQSSIQIDPNTKQIIGSTISPYQLYKSHAVAAKRSATKAEVTAQKNVAKMQTNVDRPTGNKGSRTPFDKMSLKQKEAYLRKKGHDV